MADASTLPVELELPEDDILDRSQPYRLVPEHDPPAAGQAPGVEGVVAGKIDIRPEPRLMVSEIEMAEGSPPRFGFDHLDRWDVELVLRKRGGKGGSPRRIQPQEQIQVLGVARLAVNDGGDTPHDHVGDIEPGHGTDEPGNELRKRHRGIDAGPARSPPLRKERGTVPAGPRRRAPTRIVAFPRRARACAGESSPGSG